MACYVKVIRGIFENPALFFVGRDSSENMLGVYFERSLQYSKERATQMFYMVLSSDHRIMPDYEEKEISEKSFEKFLKKAVHNYDNRRARFLYDEWSGKHLKKVKDPDLAEPKPICPENHPLRTIIEKGQDILSCVNK